MNSEERKEWEEKNRSNSSNSSLPDSSYDYNIMPGTHSYTILKDSLKKYAPIEKVHVDGTLMTEELKEDYQMSFEREFDMLRKTQLLSQAIIEMVIDIKESQQAQPRNNTN